MRRDEVVRLLSVLACSMVLIGAGAPNAPTGGNVFHARGDAFYAMNTVDGMTRAVVEYTSAMLQDPGDGHVIGARAAAYAELGQFRAALHDADTAMIHGYDELMYYYVAGRARPSIECLRRAFVLACLKGDRALIPAIGKQLLFYEVRYPYVSEEGIFP
jgi:hypothetical protein